MKYAYSLVVTLLLAQVSYSQSDASELTKNVAVQDAIQHFNNASSTFVSFSSKEDTKGNRYYFPNWVKGSVIDVNNTLYNSPAYFYNFDKINHHLFMTADKKQIVEIHPEQLQSFILNNSGATYIFKRIDAIDPNKFLKTEANLVSAFL